MIYTEKVLSNLSNHELKFCFGYNFLDKGCPVMGAFSYQTSGTRQHEDPTGDSSSSAAVYGAKTDVHG